MSKPFDYSKWDNIELSDDEDDLHPNIDKESWFRMKHRSRVEREDNESKDKANIMKEMKVAEQRIRVLEHDLEKLSTTKKAAEDADDDDDDDDDDLLDDREGLETELRQLRQENADRQRALDNYEKQKKWNVDNLCHVKDERTLVNPNAGKETYTSTGFVVETPTTLSSPPKSSEDETTTATMANADSSSTTTDSKKPAAQTKVSSTIDPAAAAAATSADKPAGVATSTVPPPKTAEPGTTPSSTKVVGPPKVELGAMETYQEFTERHADCVEEFMKCKSLEDSKRFLLQHADVLLQENASNYLLLASLEDEMNSFHTKMKLTARQSQIITNIAELAKTLKTHPGNVIQPFFQRLAERPHLEEFLAGVSAFQDKIVERAIVKKAEIDAERRGRDLGDEDESGGGGEGTDLHAIPREERLGPGGLDPLEVIETLPDVLVKAFESRDVEQLKEALGNMPPEEAEYHMKRCIDSGLWVANA